MNWFLVKLTYRIICGNGLHTPQFDEQLRLVSASTEMEAITKAKQIGEAGSHTFYNDRQQLVQWQFINISEIYCITDWMDGAEIYSQVTEADCADAYINFVSDKAASLDQRHVNSLQFI